MRGVHRGAPCLFYPDTKPALQNRSTGDTIKPMVNYITGIVIVVIVAVGGYYVWNFIQQGQGVPQDSVPLQPGQSATTTYATTTFSLVYPSNFTVDEGYAYEGVPNKPIPPIKFTIPLR